MRREIKFVPAFDRTDPDPSKNYGVGCLEFRFLVFGDSGVVEFQLLSQWYLPHVMNRRFESLKRDFILGKEDFLIKHFQEPFPTDICYFSLERKSEDDTYFKEGLDYVFDCKPCYYGYKFMDENEGKTAKDVAYWKLVEQGEEALWKYLEDYYVEIFGNET